MLIKNLNLANCKLVIGESEPIKFDEKGKVEIAPELGQELLKLKGYELVEEDKKSQPGADENQPNPKETILGKGVVEVEGLNVGEATEIKDGEEVETVETENQEESIDYESLSNKELKELIKEKGEKVPSGANKAELVEILEKLDK